MELRWIDTDRGRIQCSDVRRPKKGSGKSTWKKSYVTGTDLLACLEVVDDEVGGKLDVLPNRLTQLV